MHFHVKFLMKWICIKLGYENHHIFQIVIKNTFFFHVLKTYLTHTRNKSPHCKNKHQKLFSKFLTYLKPNFTM